MNNKPNRTISETRKIMAAFRKNSHDGWSDTAFRRKLAKYSGYVPVRYGEIDYSTFLKITTGKNAEEHFIEEYGETNEMLGLPPTAKTGKWLRDGDISMEEAKRIAAIVTHRHEETNYDDLLRSGVDKSEAREMISTD